MEKQNKSENRFEDIAKKLVDAIPDDVTQAKEDVRHTFESILQGGLNQLNLVTREEFDAQKKVLQRAQETLAALAKKVDELEAGKPSNANKDDRDNTQQD